MYLELWLILEQMKIETNEINACFSSDDRQNSEQVTVASRVQRGVVVNGSIVLGAVYYAL